jgi:hypothetical protein
MAFAPARSGKPRDLWMNGGESGPGARGPWLFRGAGNLMIHDR